jgi:Protein of unknown function (DUF998)
MIRRTAAARAGAMTLVLAPFVYAVAEMITALAWTDPRYDYIYNFVSDLGVPGPRQVAFKQTINSPLAVVMNAGFISYAVLAVLAAALLLRLAAGPRPKLLGVLTLMFAAGLSLVAVVHGSQHSVDTGLIIFHAVGAMLAIICGNVISILIGAFRHHLHMSGRLAAATIAFGILGLLSYATFLTLYYSGATANLGLFERLAIYPTAATHLTVGIAALVTWSRTPTPPRPDLVTVS